MRALVLAAVREALIALGQWARVRGLPDAAIDRAIAELRA